MSRDPPFSQWRPHPWHGLSVGPAPPLLVHAYIEVCPFDLLKYEVDKGTGYLRVNRPQRTSSQPPTLYGFIPRTYCASGVHALMPGADAGDGDLLDIGVVSERPITRGEVILNARVVGGLPMLDGGEADDEIIAVLENDPLWSAVAEVRDLPPALVERLRHYFLTYKLHQDNRPRYRSEIRTTVPMRNRWFWPPCRTTRRNTERSGSHRQPLPCRKRRRQGVISLVLALALLVHAACHPREMS